MRQAPSFRKSKPGISQRGWKPLWAAAERGTRSRGRAESPAMRPNDGLTKWPPGRRNDDVRLEIAYPGSCALSHTAAREPPPHTHEHRHTTDDLGPEHPWGGDAGRDERQHDRQDDGPEPGPPGERRAPRAHAAQPQAAPEEK